MSAEPTPEAHREALLIEETSDRLLKTLHALLGEPERMLAVLGLSTARLISGAAEDNEDAISTVDFHSEQVKKWTNDCLRNGEEVRTTTKH